MSDRNEEVMVRFPDGRVNSMIRKTAENPHVVSMGGTIIEKVVQVPKHFAPIVKDEPEGLLNPPNDAPLSEEHRERVNDIIADTEPVHKTRKPRGPNKKKH